MSTKRFHLFNELRDKAKKNAISKLVRLANKKREYDGTVLPVDWPERVAPFLRYCLYHGSTEVWDCQVTPQMRRRGIREIFQVPV